MFMSENEIEIFLKSEHNYNETKVIKIIKQITYELWKDVKLYISEISDTQREQDNLKNEFDALTDKYNALLKKIDKIEKMNNTSVNTYKYILKCNGHTHNLNTAIDIVKTVVREIGAEIVCDRHYTYRTTELNNGSKLQCPAVVRTTQLYAKGKYFKDIKLKNSDVPLYTQLTDSLYICSNMSVKKCISVATEMAKTFDIDVDITIIDK